MRFARYPQLSRILVLLGVFQMVAPSVAAISDAWRMDRREAYVHIESDSDSSCVLVHDHDCLLCAIATSGGAPPSASGQLPPCTAVVDVPSSPAQVEASRILRASSPRAPPERLS